MDIKWQQTKTKDPVRSPSFAFLGNRTKDDTSLKSDSGARLPSAKTDSERPSSWYLPKTSKEPIEQSSLKKSDSTSDSGDEVGNRVQVFFNISEFIFITKLILPLVKFAS